MSVLAWVQPFVGVSSFTGFLALSFDIWLAWYLITAVVAYRRLRHISRPPLAAVTSLWWISAAVSEKGHIALADICTKYGPIARLTPNTVITDDPDLYRKINAPQENNYRRSNWYTAFKLDSVRNNLISEIDEDRHMQIFQRLAPGYSGKDNPAAESTVDEVVMMLIQLIDRKYISTESDMKPLDFAETCQYFTLDVIAYLSLGKPFGFVTDDSDKYNYIGSLERDWPLLNLFSHVPILASISRMPAVQKLLLPKVTDREGLGKVKASVAKETIAHRFEDGYVDRHDMVTSFKKRGLSQVEIADESLMQLLAGSDTGATILRTGFLSIISNPQIYRTLQHEINTFSSTNAAAHSLNTVIPTSSSLRLSYLQSCIKESLRHHPAATGLLPRVVGPTGDTHKGIYLPPGTEVALCAWNLQRHNTAVYGADAAIFRPERWLDAPAERLAKMEETVYLAFGYGRFRCMGENIARLELNKVWFELLRRFDFALVDPLRPMERNSNYGLFVQKGMWVRVTKRAG